MGLVLVVMESIGSRVVWMRSVMNMMCLVSVFIVCLLCDNDCLLLGLVGNFVFFWMLFVGLFCCVLCFGEFE